MKDILLAMAYFVVAVYFAHRYRGKKFSDLFRKGEQEDSSEQHGPKRSVFMLLAIFCLFASMLKLLKVIHI